MAEGLREALILDISKWLSGISEASAALQSGSSQMQSSVQKLADKFDAATSQVMLLAKAFTTLAGPIIALETLANKAGTAADQLRDMSIMTEMTVEELQGWEVVLGRAGGGLQDMIFMMRTLSQQMIEARDPTSKAAQAFKDLFGNEWQKVIAMRPADVLREIAGAMHDSKDGFDKNTIAVELLGRMAMQLLPAFNRGKEGIDDAAQSSREFGELSDEQVRKLNIMKDSWEDLLIALDRVRNLMGAQIATDIQIMNEQLLKLLLTIKDLGSGPDSAFGAMNLMVQVASTAFAGLTAYIRSTGIALEWFAKGVKEIAKLNFSNIDVLDKQAKSKMDVVTADFKKNMESIWTSTPGTPPIPKPTPIQTLTAHKDNEAVKQIKSQEDALKAMDAEADRAHSLQKSRNAGQVSDAKLMLATRQIDELQYLQQIEELKNADAQLDATRDEQKVANYRTFLTTRRTLAFKDADDRKHFEAQAALELTKRTTTAAVSGNRRTAQELEGTATVLTAQIKADEEAILSDRKSNEQREQAWLKYKQAVLSGRAEVAALEANLAEQNNATLDEQLGRRLLAIETARRAELNGTKLTQEEIVTINLKAQLATTKAIQDTDTARANAAVNIARAELEIANANLQPYEALAKKRLAILDAEYARDLAAFKGTEEEKLALQGKYDALRAREVRRANDGLMEGLREGFHKYTTDTETMWNLGVDMARNAATSMQQSFSDILFDAMDGKLRTFKELWSSTFSFLRRQAANLLSAIATQQMMGQIGSNVIPVGGTGGAGAGAIGGLAHFSLWDKAGSWISSNSGSGAAAAGGSQYGSADMWTTAGINPAVMAERGGLIRPRYFAAGGPVFSNRDSVPAMLTPGEFVVSRTGVEALQRANEGISPASGKSGAAPVTITMNIASTDADGFRRSQNQIMADLYAKAASAGRRLM
jgi:hypothetical protein